MNAVLHIDLPDWLTQACAECPPLASEAERMAFVVELSRRNVETRSGGPFAAAVFEIDSGRLVAAATNLVVASHCSAAHAEVLALSFAQQSRGDHDLGADGLPAVELVGSCEPCAMCLGAIGWSGVRRVVCAATGTDAEAIGFDEGPKPADWSGELRRRGIEVVEG
ncbi:MAG: nucleoside deaminase, partial [Rhodocyclales bacterium]|nr:nucleoside deaminase [Rhodocyclales bacterium]